MQSNTAMLSDNALVDTYCTYFDFQVKTSLVFCCYQQVSDMISHMLTSIQLALSDIKNFSHL